MPRDYDNDAFGAPGYPGDEEPIRCSFCGKTRDQVRKLIKGPGDIYICDECVSECSDILEESIARDIMTQGGFSGLGNFGFMQPPVEARPPRRPMRPGRPRRSR